MEKQHAATISSEKFRKKYGEQFADELAIYFANANFHDPDKVRILGLLDEAYLAGATGSTGVVCMYEVENGPGASCHNL